MLEIVQLQAEDADFERCFEIRLAVFVREQNVPLEDERDEHDSTALHFLALNDGAPVGTARVLMKDVGRTAKIGRVAVLAAGRKLGVGAALMRAIEAAVPAEAYVLDAQVQAAAFYERLGYAAYDAEFLEAGIPHVRMRKAGRI